jgi:hypothetical protein
MGTDSLDPVIHAPARLRIAATLARAPGRGHAGLRPPAGHARHAPLTNAAPYQSALASLLRCSAGWLIAWPR